MNYNNKFDSTNKIRSFIHVNEESEKTDYPNGLTPKDIYEHYGYEKRFSGKRKTIAIIGAYYYKDAQNDLDKFSETFKLPKTNLILAYPQGKPEDVNTNWAHEAAMDLQWAHAMAPRAHLLFVSAKSDDGEDLYDAVKYAVEYGADIVSMSWGGSESEEDEKFESYFESWDRTIFVAAAGDDGGKTEYPSSSKHVLSVGGTELKINSKGEIIGEVAWRNSGGGPSKYIQMPWWQRKFGLGRKYGDYRVTPDVAFNASPDSGVSVYVTDPESGESNWEISGGTSLSAPCWAGIIASLNIDKRDLYRLLYELAGTTSYSNPYKAYRDMVQGRAGRYSAYKGYDLITGLGVPRINRMSDALEEIADEIEENSQCR